VQQQPALAPALQLQLLQLQLQMLQQQQLPQPPPDRQADSISAPSGGSCNSSDSADSAFDTVVPDSPEVRGYACGMFACPSCLATQTGWCWLTRSAAPFLTCCAAAQCVCWCVDVCRLQARELLLSTQFDSPEDARTAIEKIAVRAGFGVNRNKKSEKSHWLVCKCRGVPAAKKSETTLGCQPRQVRALLHLRGPCHTCKCRCACLACVGGVGCVQECWPDFSAHHFRVVTSHKYVCVLCECSGCRAPGQTANGTLCFSPSRTHASGEWNPRSFLRSHALMTTSMRITMTWLWLLPQVGPLMDTQVMCARCMTDMCLHPLLMVIYA
jgi:hypothetical protein